MTRRPQNLLLALAVLLVDGVAATNGPADVSARWLAVQDLSDDIAPEHRARIEAAAAAHRARHFPSKTDGPFSYRFFPQAGVLGRDLFLTNFTDLEPAAGLVRDWDCSQYTYDGHRGHDSLIRTFREQAIGVPVFAAHGGVVIDAHDGEFDESTAAVTPNGGNYVAIDHGGGYTSIYYHLKRGSVAVGIGARVAAGRQLGLTASSGFSSWPHLHFETLRDNAWVEPSAGPCRGGESLWQEQPPVVRDLYVADFYLTREPLPLDRTALMYDDFPRRASFVKGTQRIDARVDVRNLPAGASRLVRVLDPAGAVAYLSEGAYDNQDPARLVILLYSFATDLAKVGTWRFQLELDGVRVVDAPFRVVASAAQAANRPPNRVGVRLSPPQPRGEDAMTCEVETSLLFEDPDYDLVSYRYEWRIGNRLVRASTSAATTDMLAAGTAQAGDRVSCRVTPSDGSRVGRPTVARATVFGG